jgi:ribose transport system substrate-binding protein
MKWSRWLLLVCLAAALVLTACGDDDDDEGSAAGSETTEQTDANATIVEPPPVEPPTEIQVTEPLPKAPPQGKKVIFLQCELPACSRYAGGAKEASEALGWTTDFQVFKNTAPAAALEQAVAQKPDYIFISGIPVSVLKAPLAKAKAANIPVFSAADPDKPSPDGFALQVGGTLVPDAENVGKWIINDSKGKANVVAVTIPQFPVLNGQTDWFKNEWTKLCSDCEFDQLDVTVEEVGAGGIPQKLVGYLQAHPDVNYVFFTFNDLGKGVAKVLEASGLRDKVKLTGCCGDAAIAKEIAAGQQDAWTIAPNEYSAMAAYDGMARHSIGEDPAAFSEEVFPSPSWVVDSKESVDKYLKPTNFDWLGPEGFQEQFKELWQAGA